MMQNLTHFLHIWLQHKWCEPPCVCRIWVSCCTQQKTILVVSRGWCSNHHLLCCREIPGNMPGLIQHNNHLCTFLLLWGYMYTIVHEKGLHKMCMNCFSGCGHCLQIWISVGSLYVRNLLYLRYRKTAPWFICLFFFFCGDLNTAHFWMPWSRNFFM